MSKPNELKLKYLRILTQIVTVATLTLSRFRYGGGRLLVLKAAAGQAFTLPLANGKNGKFRFFVLTPITSNSTTIRTSGGTDILSGIAQVQTSAFQTASNTNTVTFNGSTTGGILGSYVEFEDIGAGNWRVNIDSPGSGTAATPFSNT